MRLLGLMSVVIFLAGCAVSPEQQARINQFQATIPQCRNEEVCKQMWEAAQVWVVRNSGFRVQVATDAIIETFSSVGNTTALAARVVKEPLGSGSYRIVVSVWCDNIFGCSPNSWSAAQDFNNTLNRLSGT